MPNGAHAFRMSSAHGVSASAISDRKSTRLNSSHRCSSHAAFCLKKQPPAAPPRITALEAEPSARARHVAQPAGRDPQEPPVRMTGAENVLPNRTMQFFLKGPRTPRNFPPPLTEEFPV